MKYFHKGLRKEHVIAMHFLGRFITGYGGKVAPPFSRYYIGGENDIRGFDIWSISPIGFIPSDTSVPVLNDNGTPALPENHQLLRRRLVQSREHGDSYYQLVFPGGDTNLTANFEYRIPIVGPVTLAPFLDVGLNKLAFTSQLALNPDRIAQLNSEFPQAGFNGRAYIAPGTQLMRSSTGLELQVLLPVVNAPFRVYFAYNPLRVHENITPPLPLDRSLFPNQTTYNSAQLSYGQPFPFDERLTTFRFTVGRTF